MNSVQDFQVVNILSTRNNLFLVKKLFTDELFVWKIIRLKNISNNNFRNKIEERVKQNYPLLVKFWPIIEDENMKVIYILMEYFPHGSFFDLIKKLEKAHKSHINEEVIVKVLYQLLTLIKKIPIYDYITLKNMFFDDDFNLKLLNSANPMKDSHIDLKVSDIAEVLLQLSTLSTKMNSKVNTSSSHYTKNFIELLSSMLCNNRSLNQCIDNILGHPAIVTNTFKLNCGLKFTNMELLDYRTKLELLRKKETELKHKEEQLKEKEHYLTNREKKLIIHERTIKDKMTQADLYLRRCKDKTIQIHKYENVDTLNSSSEYEDFEPSDIIETSGKLNTSKLEKLPFIRTFSEKRVRFKGHSPLKEMNFVRTKSVRRSKKDNVGKKNVSHNLFKDISNMEKVTITTIDDKRRGNLKHIETTAELDCRPINWTQESKKQAFDLWRLMNATSDKQFWKENTKHTYL